MCCCYQLNVCQNACECCYYQGPHLIDNTYVFGPLTYEVIDTMSSTIRSERDLVLRLTNTQLTRFVAKPVVGDYIALAIYALGSLRNIQSDVENLRKYLTERITMKHLNPLIILIVVTEDFEVDPVRLLVHLQLATQDQILQYGRERYPHLENVLCPVAVILVLDFLLPGTARQDAREIRVVEMSHFVTRRSPIIKNMQELLPEPRCDPCIILEEDEPCSFLRSCLWSCLCFPYNAYVEIKSELNDTVIRPQMTYAGRAYHDRQVALAYLRNRSRQYV